MTCSLGLYFGNTTLSIAVHKDGKNEIITNDLGDRLTPAVVSINDSEFLTGLAAKNGIARNVAGAVVNNKRLLCSENIEELVQTSNNCSISESGDIAYTLTLNERTVTCSPEEIAILLFKTIFQTANNAVRLDNNLKVVVSVPLHFSQTCRQKVWKCVTEAGFAVVQIISEPAAAVLAYGNIADLETTNILVYRLGGISCDASVVQASNGMYHILATNHRSDLGGNTFTNILADFIAKEFFNKWKIDPQESKRSMSKLRQHAEVCKHVLSTMSTSQVFIESLCDGVDWRQNITRPRFESLISPLMQKYLEPINESVKNFPINKVILCGGSTRIPKLQSTIAALFPEADLFADRPDEIIAEGCAQQASYLAQPWDPECAHLSMEIPILNKPILICDEKNEIVTQIPSQKQLPAKVSFTVCLPENQKQIDLSLYENEITSSNKLGAFSFSNLDDVIVDFEALLTKENIKISIVEAN